MCSDHFVECEFVDFMEYTMGFASKVLPERILKSTATVTCVHKVSKKLAELGTVTNTITTTARVRQCHRHRSSSGCRDQKREREKQQQQQQQTQATRNLLKVCSRHFNFFLSKVLPSEIGEYTEYSQLERKGHCLTCTVLHCQHKARDPLYSAAPA